MVVTQIRDATRFEDDRVGEEVEEEGEEGGVFFPALDQVQDATEVVMSEKE